MKECTLEKMKGYIERNERQIAMMTAQLQVPHVALCNDGALGSPGVIGGGAS